MFNVIVLKGNVTDETANSRICTTVSEGGPQTICQNLDNLKPENNSNVIESKVFTFENVPVNASFHSCIQRLIYPNVTLCDNYGSANNQGPTIEQIMLPFFGVDPADAEDDEGYGICPEYLTEVQCYGKIVKTPDDGYDINDTSIDQASKQIALTEQQELSARSLTANQIQVSNKPIVTNQTVTLKEGSNITLRGIDRNNKSLNFLIYTEPGKGTITFTKINSTSVNATYFPLEDGILTDSFSYKASNGVSESNIGKVLLTFFPTQTSDNGNTSSDIQSQPPVNQSSPGEHQPGNAEPNQTYSLTEPSAEYYKGLDWWGICNNSLVRSYMSQPCETLVSPDHRALTSQGKIALEGILCPKGPSILSTIELFYGPIPDKAKNDLGIACGWQTAR
jgi:Bacterial Ig domain